VVDGNVITEVAFIVTLFVTIKIITPIPSRCRNQTALMYAALYGHIHVVKLLVNSNVDIQAQNV
jgi:ankyrin repeat protein